MKHKFAPTSYWGFGLVLIIALAYIFNTFGWQFITGHSGFWKIKNNDLTQHLSGLNMYLSCQWQFPLLAFDSLNYPQGTRVTFIDGIPIFAFLLKVLLPHNIGYISPFGYWVVLCFVLQGFSAWWITRELKIKSWAFLIFLTLVFLTYPALLDRIRHIALMSHWLILFGIALYIRDHRLQRISIIAWTSLFFLSFYIHIYFFAMLFGIYIAEILEIKHKLTYKYIFFLASPFIFLTASLFLLLLPLPLGLRFETGFNALAMDLLSPIYGGKFIQLQADLTAHQEGFNYLGLGVIVLFLLMLLCQSLKNKNSLKKHWAFFSLMWIYFIYSLSNQVYFSGNLIATIDYPHFLNIITMQLRASGRFFWPVGYVIIIYSLYKLYHQFDNKRNFAFLAFILLLVQCADIGDFYKKLKTKGHGLLHPVNAYFYLDSVIEKPVKFIYLYPKLADYDYAIQTLLPMMQYAAMRGLKLNTGFIARYSVSSDNITEEIARSSHSESLYIFSKRFYPNIAQAYKLMDAANAVCYSLDVAFACRFQVTNQ